MKSFDVIKATGEKERFDLSKLKRSMSNAGADDKTVRKVVRALEPKFHDGITTKELYREAYKLLSHFSEYSAGRYKLKEAILELGPSGYPFEEFIGELLRRHGYNTQVGVITPGKCISHEIDVIADNDSHRYMIECKFHNRQNHHCAVSITLYIQARFEDVKYRWEEDAARNKEYIGWLVTNTRFTSEAIKYGECMGLKLLSWSYPEGKALKDLITEVNLHPVTCLRNLTKNEKHQLLKHDIVFCQQLLEKREILDLLRFNHNKKSLILNEAENICTVESA
ncbi:restriction endonuclease [Balneola sp. MJW-20]|uniref:restriction endonuclease n=1 Tax=Gracilimonas aurantiaca TaxID=3234185 RepID=UPI0034675BBF